jgi:hypothetical protein
MMNFLKMIWDALPLFATVWQAIRNLIQAKKHIYKAEQITDNQEIPALPLISEKITPLASAAEYGYATLKLAKTALFSHAAIELAAHSCGAEQVVPGVFCRVLYPIGTALAVVETGYQAGTYLYALSQPKPKLH